jgi:hypothetical protein
METGTLKKRCEAVCNGGVIIGEQDGETVVGHGFSLTLPLSPRERGIEGEKKAWSHGPGLFPE